MTAALALLATGTAFAQFANSTAKSSSSSSSSTVSTDGWSSFWVEWNPTTIEFDQKNVDDESATGLSLGFSKTFGISPSLPLFVEVGIGAQYTFNTKEMGEELGFDDDDYDACDPKLKTTLISAKVPVNLMYAFQIPNSSITLLPFVGANLRYNISGKRKLEWNFTDEAIEYLEDRYGRNWEDKTMEGIPLKGYDFDVFDKKDMGSDDNTWKRFQIGWNIGLKARINDQFLLGVSYGKDFSELAKKTKMSTTTISVGYTF